MDQNAQFSKSYTVVSYIYSDFWDRVIAVLLYDTLGLVLELGYNIIIPPLFQVTRFVKLTSYKEKPTLFMMPTTCMVYKVQSHHILQLRNFKTIGLENQKQTCIFMDILHVRIGDIGLILINKYPEVAILLTVHYLNEILFQHLFYLSSTFGQNLIFQVFVIKHYPCHQIHV